MTKVLVVGNTHFDRMFQVAQLPEPGETALALSTWNQLGGKGANQAAASAQYVATHLCSAIGQDAEGQQLRQALENFGLTAHLEVSAQQPSGSSVALIDAQSENVGIINPAANLSMTAQAATQVIEVIKPTLLVAQWEMEFETLHAVLLAARERRVPTLLNAAPWQEDYRPLLALVDHVVVNAVEAASWLGRPVDTLPEQLHFGHPSVVVTLGARGVCYYADGQQQHYLPAPKVQALSSHGAGDHFVGVLAAHLAAGSALYASLQQAGEAAAKFVQLFEKPAYRLPYLS